MKEITDRRHYGSGVIDYLIAFCGRADIQASKKESPKKSGVCLFIFNNRKCALFWNRQFCLSAVRNACTLDRQRLLGTGILSFFPRAGTA